MELDRNELSGTIPTELGGLTNLDELYLNNNELSGTIPAELGGLTNLGQLYLDRNELSGTIPPELGGLSNLEILQLDENELSGTIPAELGGGELENLYLNDNQLSGTIPVELGDGRLRQLALNNNQLSGTIPTELGTLNNLLALHLENNQLSGTIPAELGTLGRLRQLALNNNQLSGAIPTELGTLGRLRQLVLNNNQLSGTIPAELGDLGMGDLGSLEVLYLNDNQLSGEIPAELGDLGNLVVLYLNDNQLSGEIPAELGDLSNLEVLWLNSNDLRGDVPSQLESLSNEALQEFTLWDNEQLSWDTISDALGKRTDRVALKNLYVKNNGANWTLKTNWFPLNENPNGLFSFSSWYGVSTDATTGRVSALDLRDNNLEGEVAARSLEALDGLKRLDLSYNALTGVLAQSLADLDSLMELNIRCTNIMTPSDVTFRDWLEGITFIETQVGDGCSSPPPMSVTNVSATRRVNQLSVSWEEVTDATGYRVQWKSGMEDYNKTDRQYVVTSGSTTSYSIAGLTAGTPYTVRVTATKTNADDAIPSDEVMGTPSDEVAGTPSTPRAPAPGQVTGVMTIAGWQELSVSWEEVTDATGYKVQWKSGMEDYNETDRQHAVESGSTTSYLITGLTAGTLYTVRVTATKTNADDAIPSDEVTDIPSDEVTDIPSDEVTDTPSDEVTDTPSDGKEGGCAIALNTGVVDTPESILFNLVLVMSALLGVSWKNGSRIRP